jgi:hypothetical protein
MVQKLLVALVITSFSAPAACAQLDCAAIDAAASRSGVFIQGYESGRDVIGKGRVQFYSAPDRRCKMKGTFVIPGDTLNAYIEFAGFTSVMFINLKTGTEANGWVETSRLRENGYGIAPRQ